MTASDTAASYEDTSVAAESGGLMLRQRASRRAVMRGALLGGAGLAAAALIGCGDGDDDDDGAAPAATAAPTTAPTAAPTATAAPTEPPLSEAAQGVRALNAQAEKDGAPFPYDFEEPDTPPKAGGILKMAYRFDIGSWDQSKVGVVGTTLYNQAAYNRLVGFKHGPGVSKFLNEIEPELAQTWELSDDGLTYTFNIVPGIKYPNVAPVNGRDFTSADIKFVYERHGQEETSVHKQYFSLVSAVETPNDDTLVVRLSQPSPDFLVGLALRWNVIYPREPVDNGTIDTQLPVGTGPLITTEAVPSSHVTMESNPDYWEGKPLLDGLDVRIMPDENAQLAAFRAGQVDLAAMPSDLATLHSVHEETNNQQVNDPILMATNSVGFQLKNPKFSDVRVRRALGLALRRDQLLDILYDGSGLFVPVTAWPFVLDAIPDSKEFGAYWHYDADEAKKLLSAAGAEDLEFPLLASDRLLRGIGTREMEILQQQWAEIGVKMELQVVDYSEYNRQWFGNNFEEVASGTATVAPTADGFFFDQVHPSAVTNRWGIDDAEVTDWAERQKVELDPDARRELHVRIFDKVLDQVYRIERTAPFPNNTQQNWVRNFRFSYPFISHHWVYEWGDQFHTGWLDRA